MSGHNHLFCSAVLRRGGGRRREEEEASLHIRLSRSETSTNFKMASSAPEQADDGQATSSTTHEVTVTATATTKATSKTTKQQRIVLVGGGHAHVQVGPLPLRQPIIAS